MDILATIAKELNIKETQVENAVKLIDEGNTIPFIARYRKEAHGSLTDTQLRDLSDRLTYLRNLEEAKEKAFTAIEAQGKMTPEIEAALANAATMTEVEDIYRPYRPKRRTRATIAKEKGLEPLALLILEQDIKTSPAKEAEAYIDAEKGVETVEDALAGASDIIAEIISDDAELRRRLRYVCRMNGKLTSKKTEEDAGVYENYADYSEPIARMAGHRILAVNRGEREDKLKISIDFERTRAENIIISMYVKNDGDAANLVLAAARDAYDRLIFPSIEREIRNEMTDGASEAAIRVFGLNLRQLLMQPPIRNRVALGMDPGYRTGCKLAVVDGTGKVLDTGVIYPAPPHSKLAEARATVIRLVKKHGVTVFAIGNGTASHETEEFAASLLSELPGVSYMVVSEAGASVYSASELAAKEFPEYDVSLRSAVSIARRLQDPLAELVKIDPKAIGVGQYQHDMPPKELSNTLDGVVEDCVNSVGADLNTASAPLLSHIAGLGPALAANVVKYREENGAFKSRTELKKVPKLGPKAFEQCAGFLRVHDGKEPLDNTAVHPESYAAAKELLSLCGYDTKAAANGLPEIAEKCDEMGRAAIAEKLGIGEQTLNDIISELTKPGRDPRDSLPPPMLRSDIMDIDSLIPGMELTGTVRNLVDFGAFVDIGVHQDGLVHISRIAGKRINHPIEVLSVGDRVTVWVLDVDKKRNRISLTMQKPKNTEEKK
ncbi:MAG: RNA-binding transcriptional accessory protein [Clostridia bacterium]|nr:RNA-binding transcriptional accessory protein [Clostridia bacterium]